MLLTAISGTVAYNTIIELDWSLLVDLNETSFFNFPAKRVDRLYMGTGHNVAYALGVLWLRDNTILIGSVGKDFIKDDFFSSLINYDHLTYHKHLLTGHAWNIIDNNWKQLSMRNHGATYSDTLFQSSFKTKYLLVSSSNKQTMISHLQLWRRRGCITLFDPWIMLSLFDKEDLELIKPYIDYMTVNGHEFFQLCDILQLKKEDTHLFYNNLIVTLWNNGVDAWIDGAYYHVESYHNTVIDSTGAGDAFRWWLLAGFMTGKDIITSLKYWSILWSAAITVSWTIGYNVSPEQFLTI